MNSVILLDEIKEYIADMQTGIKKVQRGISASATTIAIDAVNMSKAFVVSVSKGSGGYVAARGTVGQSGSVTQNIPTITASGGRYSGYSLSDKFTSQSYGANQPTDMYMANGPIFSLLPFTLSASGSISGGSTDLTTKQYSAKLISATQLQTDGACEWQVIEFM